MARELRAPARSALDRAVRLNLADDENLAGRRHLVPDGLQEPLKPRSLRKRAMELGLDVRLVNSAPLELVVGQLDQPAVPGGVVANEGERHFVSAMALGALAERRLRARCAAGEKREGAGGKFLRHRRELVGNEAHGVGVEMEVGLRRARVVVILEETHRGAGPFGLDENPEVDRDRHRLRTGE